MGDPWIDPPGRVRRWLPSARDASAMTWLRRVVVAVLVVGVGAFVVQGADEPADPVLVDPADGGEVPGQDGGAAGPTTDPFGEFGDVLVTIRSDAGTRTDLCFLHAATPEQRQRGLMEVTDLQGYEGMVFTFERDTDGSFWMRNTPMPLSIAWLDAGGAVVDATDMEPCPDGTECPTYAPSGSYRTAVEVPQGRLADLGIVAGATVELGGPCP